ncbi:lysozyme inhibitor LprI family protein [Sphingomonas edaphi]|uniref:DUF1311 domain-containing protein n=1 Tax=Sphingomonas edaphi TaxID=2315689 RepID=A0A418PYA7_9SPHN|nr:lysozyme inhibitor LprI family protein [Sphingomonas edaphi]RIX26978.1 DUF1311 domain-containing protein [Sphingomonas edaphi]
MKIYGQFLAALGSAAIWSASPVSAEMYNAEYRQCADGPTADILECLQARSERWDKQLNVNFRNALQRAEGPQKAALRQAQRAWIEYRDANCEAYGARQGSLRLIEAAECIRSMTAERASELQNFAMN